MTSLNEFWPIYLSMHKKQETRLCHVAGIIILLPEIILGFVFNNPTLGVLAGVLGCYALAFTGHLVFEKNYPATFKNPFLSILCDFKMSWLTLTGKL